ncbi:MAG: CHAT domain-containing protein [Cyanobium sp.]
MATNTPIYAAPQASAPTNPPAPASQATPASPATRKAVRAAQAADEAFGKLNASEQRSEIIPRMIKVKKQALQAWEKTGMDVEIHVRRIQLAALYLQGGDLRLGQQVIKEALQASSNPQSPTFQWRISELASAAMLAQEAGDYHSAIGFFRELIEIGKKQGSLKFIGSSFNSLAGIYSSLGEYNEASKAMALNREFLKSYKGSEPTAPRWHSLLHADVSRWFQLGEINRAMLVVDEVKRMQASVLSQESEKDRSGMQAMASVVGAFACDKPATSTPNLIRSTSSAPSGSRLVSSQGWSPAKIEQTAKAKSKGYGYAEQIEKAKAEGVWMSEAAFLDLEAVNALMSGDLNQAVILNQRALALARKRHAAPQEAALVRKLAEIAIDQGKPQQGLQLLQQALSLQEALGLRPDQANTLKSISFLYKSLGAEPQSLSYAEKARFLAESLSIPAEEITALSMIASIHKQRQRLPEAEQALLQAMSIAERSGNCWQQSQLHNQLATLLADSGNLRDAAIHAAKADTIAGLLLSDEYQRFGQALARRVKANVLLKQGNPQAAAKQAEDALRLIKQRSNPRHQTYILTTLAEAHVALGDLPKAVALYQQQLDLLTAMNLPPEKAQTLYAVAQLQRRQGDRAAALATINQAIAIVEAMRKQVVDPELRTSFFASKQDFYTFKIDLLLEWHHQQPGVGHAAEAFHTSERSRARTLLELLDDARADVRQGIAPDLLEQDKTLQDRRTALDKRWQQAFSERGDPSLLPQLQQERQQLLQQTQELRQTIRARSPRYAALTDPEPLTLEQVQQQLLDPQTVLLHYALGADRSHLWVVTHDAMQVHRLPPKHQIREAVCYFRSSLGLQKGDGCPGRSQDDAATALSQLLLSPAVPVLRQKQRLIVVADDVLHYVPLASLPLPGQQRLVQSHTLIQLPSSSTLALIRADRQRSAAQQQQQPRRGLALLADPIFDRQDQRLQQRSQTGRAAEQGSAISLPLLSRSGDELRSLQFEQAVASFRGTPEGLDSATDASALSLNRLPATRTEAESIRSLFPRHEVSMVLDEQANLRWATDPALAQYRRLHFATHGLLNLEKPALSGLVLSRWDRQGRPLNGYFQLADVFNLNLNAETVVLSACDTGLAKEVRGEGLVGMTRGFLYAGSQRVVVSLWKVDDKATAALMTRFYQAMEREKLPPSQALRVAQRHLITIPQWSSPYYWAAFVLQGEW